MILAGRRINDGMGAYVAQRVIKLMSRRRPHATDPRILVLGLTFKENCPDLRNTKVIDIVDANCADLQRRRSTCAIRGSMQPRRNTNMGWN